MVIKFLLRFGLPLLLLLVSAVGLGGTSLQQKLNDIPIVNGIIERASTIFTVDETLDTSSLEWREFEYEESLRSLSETPWLGVSLGNAYRQTTTLQGEVLGWWTDGNLAAGEVSRFTRFIHSSYLAIAVKMGIPGIAAFLWFCLAFFVYGWRLFYRLPVGMTKGIVLAIVSGFIGLMQWSIFHTHFMRSESTVTVGIMVGIVGSIHLLTREDAVVVSPSTAVSHQPHRQSLQLAKLSTIFNKGSGFYGLLLLGISLIVMLLVVEPLVRNRTAVSLFSNNQLTTETQLPDADSADIPVAVANASQKLNIIQPLDLQTFEPEGSIFVSWIWSTKLQPEQQFTVILLNNEQQIVLGTQSQVGSNNRYWLKTTVPSQIPSGEYQLFVQLQSSTLSTTTASSPQRIIYILDKPESPTPTNTPTPTSTTTPMPTTISMPLVQIFVSSISLREGPGSQYGVINYLYTDDVVQVIAKDDLEGEWYNVILEDGTYGWVVSKVTVPLDEAAITAVSPAATIPPLPTSTNIPIPTRTPTPTSTPINPPPQEDPSGPPPPPPTFTPPPPP